MLRALAHLALALALLLSPLAMKIGGGMAIAHAPVASADGDCAAMRHASPDDDDRSADAKMSCALSCAAIAAFSSAIGERAAPAGTEAVRAALPALSGIQPERETPPPRAIPRI